MKHSHYKKDVSGLSMIDVYRVCDLFGVQDPSGATQHAIKKLLLPGQRGGKSMRQDLQEAVDSLNRRIQMLDEDEGGSAKSGYPAIEIGVDVRFDQSGRQEAVEQNGNDGAAYATGGPNG